MLRTSPRKRQEERRLLNEYAILLHKRAVFQFLRSRFDYKGMFNLLTEEDKLKFVHFRVNQIVDKYKEFVSTDLPERIHGEVVGAIDVTQFKNMRDLNKKIKDTFVERIKVSV